MMKNSLQNLYDLAQLNNIDVLCLDSNKAESISIMDENDCYIGINPFMLDSVAEEKTKLAHELGHCVLGAFYNQYSPLSLREKCEYKADIWAIKKLIPKDELSKAYQYCNNSYELSEYFNVTEEFIKKALCYYKECIR